MTTYSLDSFSIEDQEAMIASKKAGLNYCQIDDSDRDIGPLLVETSALANEKTTHRVYEHERRGIVVLALNR